MEDRLNGDHPVVRAWRALAGPAARPDGIVALERAWKRRPARPVFRLRRAARPAFDVIAKPAKRDEADRTLVLYRDLLPHLPVRVPQLIGCVQAEEPDRVWLFIEHVGGEEYRPEAASQRRLAGCWLATVHAAATTTGRGGHLERLGYLYDIEAAAIREHVDTARALLPKVSTNPTLTQDDRRALAGIAAQVDRLADRWEALVRLGRSAPRTLVHGDFCVSNMLVQQRDGAAELVVFDWQRAGWASPAFDYTRFLGSWADPDLDTYLQIAGRLGLDLDAARVRRLAYMGEVMRWIEALRWDVERLTRDAQAEPTSRLGLYRRWMDDIERAAPWRDEVGAIEAPWRSFVPYGRPARLADGAPVHA